MPIFSPIDALGRPATRTVKGWSPTRVSSNVSAPRYSTAATLCGQAVRRELGGFRPDADRERIAGASVRGRREMLRNERGRNHIHRRRADEARRENGGGLLVERGGRRVLLDAAVAHQHHLVRHGHRLDLIMRDVQHGHAEAALQCADFAPHLDTQLGVEVRQRLIHQADARLRHDGAAERHTLLLPAGELRRLAFEQPIEPENSGGALQARIALGARHIAHPQAEQDVLGDRQVRKQRVALEHHRDAALGGRQRGHIALGDPDRAGIRCVEPGDQPQGGGLAAAGRAEQRHEMAGRRRKADVVDRGGRSPSLRDPRQTNVRHRRSIGSGRRRRQALGKFSRLRAGCVHKPRDCVARNRR